MTAKVKSMLQCVLVLAAIALVSGLLLGAFHIITYVDPLQSAYDRFAEDTGKTFSKMTDEEGKAYENGNVVYYAVSDDGVYHAFLAEGKGGYGGSVQLYVYIKDGKIDFTRPPEEVERMIRAFDPWPGSFCFMGDETIKIWKAHVIDRPAQRPSGEILAVSEKSIEISCGGKVLAADEIQAPGKKRLRADEYIRGRSVKPGDILR